MVDHDPVNLIFLYTVYVYIYGMIKKVKNEKYLSYIAFWKIPQDSYNEHIIIALYHIRG